MKKLIFFLLLFCSFTFGYDITVKLSPEKTLFHKGEKIKIHFKVINTSDKIIHLKLSDFKPFNYYIKAYTPEHVPIKERDTFFARYLDRYNGYKKGVIKTDFSDIKIEPNEIIGMVIDLNEIYDLVPGTYLLRGEFYPLSVVNNPMYVYKSPTIKIIVKEEIKTPTKLIPKECLKALTPQQAIKNFFDGKMERNWQKFFSSINLRELIKYFQVFREAYKKATDDEKNKIIEDFKQFLKDLNSDEKLIGYDIEEIIIRKNKAIAKVITTSRFQHLIIKREYKIGLVLYDQWYIYGYSVLQKR